MWYIEYKYNNLNKNFIKPTKSLMQVEDSAIYTCLKVFTLMATQR